MQQQCLQPQLCQLSPSVQAGGCKNGAQHCQEGLEGAEGWKLDVRQQHAFKAHCILGQRVQEDDPVLLLCAGVTSPGGTASRCTGEMQPC